MLFWGDRWIKTRINTGITHRKYLVILSNLKKLTVRKKQLLTFKLYSYLRNKPVASYLRNQAIFIIIIILKKYLVSWHMKKGIFGFMVQKNLNL